MLSPSHRLNLTLWPLSAWNLNAFDLFEVFFCLTRYIILTYLLKCISNY